jgi:hypothetical protein
LSPSFIQDVDGLVVVSLVTMGRHHECDAMQVLASGPSRSAVYQTIRKAGFKKARPTGGTPKLRLAPAELQKAIDHPGVVFERRWLSDDDWQPVENP